MRNPHASLVIVDGAWWFLAPERDLGTEVAKPSACALEALSQAVIASDESHRTPRHAAAQDIATELGLLDERPLGSPPRPATPPGMAEVLRYRALRNAVSFLDYADAHVLDRDRDRMETYARRGPCPPAYKSSPADGRICLPHPACMRAVETARDKLGRLLFWAFGRIRGNSFHGMLPAQHKAVPSQGARHPIEAYLVIAGGAGPVDDGFYHYHVPTHALHRLPDEDAPAAAPNTCSLFITTIFERYQWRYRDRWVYRMLFLEVGHVSAMLDRVADDMGLRLSVATVANSPQWPDLAEECLAARTIGGWA